MVTHGSRVGEHPAQVDEQECPKVIEVERLGGHSAQRREGKMRTQPLRGLDGQVYTAEVDLWRANENYLRDHGGHWY